MTGHYSLDELSDWVSDGLSASRSAEVTEHLATCDDCTARVEALEEVSATLAAAPAPAMPADVFGRLSGVVAAESQRRAAHRRRVPVIGPRPSLGSLEDRLGSGLGRPRPGRRAGIALASLGVAAALAFGGYVVSASAGLNEPTAGTPVTINPGTLGAQAAAIRARQDPGPHRFSNAWQCARQVTDGRITGLWPVSVGGEPAIMVYLVGDGNTRVVVVQHCSSTPVAGPTATIPDR